MPTTARTFRNGNSEAIRLPKGIGFGIGAEVTIAREGNRVVLTPVADRAAARRDLEKLVADLRAIGVPADGVQPRDPFEFLDRPGL